MSKLRSDFLRTLDQRGFIHQCTDLDNLDQEASQGRIVAYIGYDLTATSLHVGNLVQIMLLRWLQQTGHRPIVLMGGGTTKVGDPSGKEEMRQLLDLEGIARNKESIRRIFAQFLTFGDGPTDAMMVDNAEWLDELRYIAFLRDYGRHFSVNRMLTMDSVRLRLEREQPLSFLEFNYMVLQAYDFMELARRYDCALQMGGSDQWGNIVNGIELARRVDSRELFGLTAPLITTADGAKMGKTAQGAVWLNDQMLPAYDFWQYWRNVQDADVGRFLKLFTDLPLDEIARLAALEGQEINDAKIVLADEVTAMCHGKEAAARARETARRTFDEGAHGDSLPRIAIGGARLGQGIKAIDLLIEGGLCDSKGAARRLIRQGGARLNDEKISDEEQLITAADITADGVIKLSAGKKRHALITQG